MLKEELFNRIEETDGIFAKENIKKDCSELLKKMHFYQSEVSLNNYLKLIDNFFEKYHQGNDYFVEEVMILFYLSKLEVIYLNKGLDKLANAIHEEQINILNLTSDDKEKEVKELYKDWIYFSMRIDSDISIYDDMKIADLFYYDLRNISKEAYKNFFNPYINLIYSTGIYFINKEGDENKKISHCELFLVHLITSLFLSCIDKSKTKPNAYYYVLDELIEKVIKDEFKNNYLTILVKENNLNESIKIRFIDIETFKKDIVFLEKRIGDIDMTLNDDFGKSNI